LKLATASADEFSLNGMKTFLSFVQRCCPGPDFDLAKRWALSYIAGFHAADPTQISVHSIIKGLRADEEVQAERAFRLPNGYASLVGYFERELRGQNVPNHLRTIVQQIDWKRGGVKVTADSVNQPVVFQAPQVLITLPLPVLQSRQSGTGCVCFSPNCHLKSNRP